MALLQKLEDDEAALYEIVTDPIWLNEFLRSTSDGEIDKNVYPQTPWTFRDYQRQFLTDTTEFILYLGGRAIGKCSPAGSRVYTTDGYQTLANLAKQPYCVTYTLDKKTHELVQRRAVVVKDRQKAAYTITTESGHEFIGTDNHPLLTSNGWKRIDEIHVHDHVAVTTRLPWESQQRAMQWHELRLLGYVLLMPKFRAETKILPRYKKIGKELEVIAEKFITNWRKTMQGYYSFHARQGPFKHPITSFTQQIGVFHALRQYGITSLPKTLMKECLENIALFIEALFSQYATTTLTEVSLVVRTKALARDIQELLLRFGIESRIFSTDSIYTIELLDYRARYRFFTTFTLPGVSIGTLPLPPASLDVSDSMRFDRVVSIVRTHELTDTYAVHVYEHNNYIGDNFYVHNSIVLEDKIVYDVVNSYTVYPHDTPELVLVTANQAQMTPLQNRLISRFSSSPFLRDFLRGQINKSTGVLTFPRKGKPFILTMRIAGSRGENNMVSLGKLAMYKEVRIGEYSCS